MIMRIIFCAAASLATVLLAGSMACAMSIKTAGTLPVPPNVPLIAVSTDPVVQRVLSQDFDASGREPDPNARTSVTITVTVHQNALRPGLSLSEVREIRRLWRCSKLRVRRPRRLPILVAARTHCRRWRGNKL